jgi:antitoxin component YwqK of YwqJK toxin-antitoxin module
MKYFLLILIPASFFLTSCSNSSSQEYTDGSDSCSISKKFENAALVEQMVQPGYSGVLTNYRGLDTTKLDFKHEFKEGRLIRSRFFYLNGNVEEEYSFKCGALHGLQKWYYENGKIEKIIPYSYGYRQGTGKLFDSTGRLRQEVLFINDSISGTARNYDESGKPLRDSLQK